MPVRELIYDMETRRPRRDADIQRCFVKTFS